MILEMLYSEQNIDDLTHYFQSAGYRSHYLMALRGEAKRPSFGHVVPRTIYDRVTNGTERGPERVTHCVSTHERTCRNLFQLGTITTIARSHACPNCWPF